MAKARIDKRAASADLSPERERFAEALAVESVHGNTAVAFIAERVSALAAVSDVAGEHRWREIANCYDRLQQQRKLQS